MSAKENAQSVKVLDELMQKLTIAKEASAIKEASVSIASFINGRIEDVDAPTRYITFHSLHFLVISPGIGCQSQDYCNPTSLSLSSVGK